MSYRPYIATSAINKPIPANPPIHPASSKMISPSTFWLLGGTSYDKYREWMKPIRRAVYYRGDLSKLPKVPVYVNWSATQHKAVCATTPVQMPMPPWFAGILMGSNTVVNQDRNVVLVDSVTGDVWETWHLTPPGLASLDISCPSNRWNALIANRYPADTVSHTGYDGPLNPSPASASKIHYAAGLLVPEDFADLTVGSVIPHALKLGCRPGSNGSPFPRFVPPARYGDGITAGGIPYGARIQLDPSIDVANRPTVQAKPEPWRSALTKILRTLQVYGCLIDDRSAGPGTGGLDCCNAASVAQGTYNGKTGYQFPFVVSDVSYAIPYDLMGRFRVIEYAKWTGA